MPSKCTSCDVGQCSKSVKTISKEDELEETFVVIPPDGGWGWVVVAAAFYSFVIIDGINYSFGVLLESMARDLGCSKSNVSMAGAIATSAICLSGPLVASLVNKFGYRKVGVFGSVISIISCIATSFGSEIYSVHFTHGFLGGIGFGMIHMPALIAVGFYFERWRGLATGIAFCGAGIGGFLLPILISVLTEKYGWRPTFKILAVFVSVCLICTLLFRPIKPTIISKVKRRPVCTSSNFMNMYHNKAFPTLSEITECPTVTLLQPRKMNISSELMVTSYKSSSILCKCPDDEVGEQPIVSEFTLMDMDKSSYSKQITKDKKRRNSQEAQTTPKPVVRPMYRDDIFYGSSFNVLQKHQRRSLHTSSQKPSLLSKCGLDYHLSVTRMITAREIEEESTSKCGGFCTEAVKRTLATMLDVKLLQSPPFVFISLNAVMISLGYYTPYMFLNDRTKHSGMPGNVAVWLTSIIGAMNTIGRIVCGVMATFPKVDCVWLTSISLLIGGVATLMSVHFNSSTCQILYAAVYGGCVACVAPLRTIIIVDYLGIEKLTNAFGLMLMFQGVASLLGTAISGVLRDLTGDYFFSFYFAGICIITGALCMLPLKRIAKWQQRTRESKVNIPERDLATSAK